MLDEKDCEELAKIFKDSLELEADVNDLDECLSHLSDAVISLQQLHFLVNCKVEGSA